MPSSPSVSIPTTAYEADRALGARAVVFIDRVTWLSRDEAGNVLLRYRYRGSALPRELIRYCRDGGIVWHGEDIFRARLVARSADRLAAQRAAQALPADWALRNARRHPFLVYRGEFDLAATADVWFRPNGGVAFGWPTAYTVWSPNDLELSYQDAISYGDS